MAKCALRPFLRNSEKKIERFQKNVFNFGSRNVFQTILYHLSKSHLIDFLFSRHEKMKSGFQKILTQ